MSRAVETRSVYAADRYRELARFMRQEAQHQKKSTVREVYETYAADLERWAGYVEEQMRRYG